MYQRPELPDICPACGEGMGENHIGPCPDCGNREGLLPARDVIVALTEDEANYLVGLLRVRSQQLTREGPDSYQGGVFIYNLEYGNVRELIERLTS